MCGPCSVEDLCGGEEDGSVDAPQTFAKEVVAFGVEATPEGVCRGCWRRAFAAPFPFPRLVGVLFEAISSPSEWWPAACQKFCDNAEVVCVRVEGRTPAEIAVC